MLYTGLKDVLRTFDEHGWKGSFTRGLWEIGNGGYDCWFELYYKGLPVAQCIAGELESNCAWVSDVEKEKLLGKILEVYDHLKVRNFKDDFLENLTQESANEETINIWFDKLLESKNKSNVDELSYKEILEEIEDVKGTIKNEEITLGLPGSFAEENIKTFNVYLEKLNSLYNKAKEKEGSLDDVIKSCENMSKNGETRTAEQSVTDKER